MKTEIKIFNGSKIVDRIVKDIENEFNVKIIYCNFHTNISSREEPPKTISANMYFGFEGDVEDLLRLSKYITGCEVVK